MTQETDFFDNIGGGSGAPSPHLKNVNDMVSGEIVDMYKRDYIPFGQKEPAKREDGTNQQQLVIVLQTAHRNWENVAKVPDVDTNDPSKGQKTPDQDDGKRALYVPEGKNIQYAIGRAAAEAKVKPAVGGTLAVRIFNLKPTDKGNPLKEHEARYTPPAAGAQFFAQAPAAPAQAAPPAAAPAPVAQPVAAPAPVAQPVAAPVAQDPWATPAAPAAPAATPGDPWATPAPATSQPPF